MCEKCGSEFMGTEQQTTLNCLNLHVDYECQQSTVDYIRTKDAYSGFVSNWIPSSQFPLESSR